MGRGLGPEGLALLRGLLVLREDGDDAKLLNMLMDHRCMNVFFCPGKYLTRIERVLRQKHYICTIVHISILAMF